MIDKGFVNSQISPDGVAFITFGHPNHNALPSRILNELTTQIMLAGENEDVKLILLQSDGDTTFCAGANFDELLAIDNEAAGKAFFSGFAQVINAIRTSRKLVFARVQGKAVGGGVGLMAACDYCFATHRAAVKLSEISINIGPFVIAPALIRKIGISAFTQLTLNPITFFDAQWALRQNLIFDLYEDSITMDQGIKLFMDKLLDKNQDALNALKETLWIDTAHWDELLYSQAAISGRLVLSKETRSYLEQFKNKA